MKKYLLGIFALVLAIGFSAFTTDNNAPAPVGEKYWYQVELDGAVYRVVTYLGFIQKATAQTTTSCLTSGTTQCAKGFTSDPAIAEGEIITGGNDFLYEP